MSSSFTNIQKAPSSTLSQAGMAELSTMRTPESIALDFPWDITSPEGIIAFFGAKMHDKNAELKNMMQGQEARNAAIRDIKSLTDLLGKYDGDNKLQPGTPDYAEFQRLSAEVGPSLGVSASATSVKAAMDATTARGPLDRTFALQDANAAVDFVASNGGGTIESGLSGFVAHAKAAQLPIDAGTCKDIKNKLQGIADGYSSDNQMDTIRVQDLVNQISQITNLASNIVHSFNEAAMGPIGNIK